ncbi:MAG: phenylalanine--tRNA ligase beta subunit-related protein [Thermoguttaceae bacterium]
MSQILAVTLPMLPLTIAPEFKSKIPNVVVGRITASVRNSQHDEALWQEIEAVAVRFRGVALDEARKSPPIKALRDAYRALGNDPTRCRGSNEALVRRISQGKDLHRVNTVADINNLVSLQTLHSAGTFDLDRVQPPIIFRVGQPGEVYAGIGRGEIKIEGLPVFADQAGPFGSTTSDSERTMVQLDTTRIMTVIISFLGTEGMDVALQRVAGLLARYAAATGIETGVVA